MNILKAVIFLFFGYVCPSIASQTPNWQTLNMEIKDNGAIYEKLINKAIYPDDFEIKRDAYLSAIVLHKGFTPEEFLKLDYLRMHAVLRTNLSKKRILEAGDFELNLAITMDRYSTNNSPQIPETFSVGYPLNSIKEEYKFDQARDLSYLYLPDWSEFSATYTFGEVGYGTYGTEGTITIEFDSSNEYGAKDIKLTKTYEGTKLEGEIEGFPEQGMVTTTMRYWEDGRIRMTYEWEYRPEVSCYSKNQTISDLVCENGTIIPKTVTNHLIRVIQMRDFNALKKDWIFSLLS